jgi:transposase
MLDLMMKHQAGIPALIRPLSGNTRNASDFGYVVIQHIEHPYTIDGTTYLVADSAHYSEENLLQGDHPSYAELPRAGPAGSRHSA